MEGRSKKKSFYIIFLEIVIKKLGSGIQVVGEAKMLVDSWKCRAWLSARQHLFQTNFECAATAMHFDYLS